MTLLHSLSIDRLHVPALLAAIFLATPVPGARAAENAKIIELGREVFNDQALSADGKTSCGTCHDASHAYADPRPRSIGVLGKTGTRNAPSLIGIADDDSFLWDGRRTRLEDVVLDPFTNPVELGLKSKSEILGKLRLDPLVLSNFHAAFPNQNEVPTFEQVRTALGSFIHSLASQKSALGSHTLSAEAKLGQHLFDSTAGCAECHSRRGARPRYSDGQYHHSGIGPPPESLAKLSTEVVRENLDADAIGPRVLSDPGWSSLGRFVVSHKPADLGAFRTPSLRNVAATAPYMHDGSIATLTEAVDHEIYYRRFSNGHSIDLSVPERQALVEFLKTLTDTP